MKFNIEQIKIQINNILMRIKTLKLSIQYEEKKNKINNIKDNLKQSNVWNQSNYTISTLKQLSILKKIVKSIKYLDQEIKYINDFVDLLIKEKDSTMYLEIINAVNKLKKKLSVIEFKSMFTGEYDQYNCYLDIQSGSGGIEAQDWSKILFKMYLKWIELHKFYSEIIEESNGEVTGIKSATIKVTGDFAYGWLRTETGIHRLVRKSPFDSGKRHTSFCSIFVYPEINKDINVKINSSDLRIDFYRSSGAGGQHVNRTESAVRIVHIPTNIKTQCQKSRSQHKNKDQAMKQLKAKLYNFISIKKNNEKRKIEDSKSDICWGNQIRSYIFDDSRIKDLRTGLETRDIHSVLNGNLDQFIKESLKQKL